MFCIPKILKNESNSQRFRRRSKKGLVVLYPKDTEKWKQFTTSAEDITQTGKLFCIPKILKNESNSQPIDDLLAVLDCCFVSQRYWKMKAIHNRLMNRQDLFYVVLYPKDTEKWKQFTTVFIYNPIIKLLFCIPKILKNESNSQQYRWSSWCRNCCFVSQRYWKMKAIHNLDTIVFFPNDVVLYPKDTEKWKQFTTAPQHCLFISPLFCIPKILKNESNSQLEAPAGTITTSCFVSQRYWKMKAIHNKSQIARNKSLVVLYPKDTEKWKQFTTEITIYQWIQLLFCIPKILKNESNSQPKLFIFTFKICCFVSQRYWKMKAIHNLLSLIVKDNLVVLYPKDTEKWKQFTTVLVLIIILYKLFCIPKILKNESNSQHLPSNYPHYRSCFVSQRYWKMKAIHNTIMNGHIWPKVVLYPKDTEKWKQFTTYSITSAEKAVLFCIPKILKNESNSQLSEYLSIAFNSCFVSQRYWKMKAIHNDYVNNMVLALVVLYPKDTEKWKQFTTK